MSRSGRELAASLPPIKRLRRQRDELAASDAELRRRVAELEQRLSVVDLPASVRMAFPPGHYYSPIPDLAELVGREAKVYGIPPSVPGVEINAAHQLDWVRRAEAFYAELPFPETGAVDGLRYQFDNPFFSYGDGLALYSMLRLVRPPRVLEIGSGWSSALTLDVDERFLGGATQLTFIEPYTERLDSLLRDTDRSRVTIHAQPLHAVDPAVFAQLRAGDVMFIDSTHVGKIGSDVNQLLLEVLPTLPPGVHVHVHDIGYPFEYPREWVEDGRAWNEAYLLRAFLVQNRHWRINWWNSYLGNFHADVVRSALPLWDRNHGGSIWLETVEPD